MSYTPITPARLAWAADGTPFSEAFGDVYHSVDGGLGQARAVFLGGNGLPDRWAGRAGFTILETGFGLGLNFMATWQAWREHAEPDAVLHFVSIEKFPFVRADLAILHQRWPELAELSAELLAQWPEPVAGLHRLHLAGGRVCLTLAFGDVEQILPKLVLQADALFLDGFAPAKNPDMWSASLARSVSRLVAEEATLATYTVAAAVRQALHDVGFVTEKMPGYGRKRDRLQGRYAPQRRTPPGQRPSASRERRAIVIGAGLAGTAACARLVARGWQIALIDRQPGPAMETSGNLAGIFMPVLTADDNLAARLSRAGLLYGLRAWPELEPHGLRWQRCGVFQIGKDDKHEAEQARAVGLLGLPESLVRYLDRGAARQLLDVSVTGGGWHFPGCGWLSPPTLCEARLRQCGAAITRHYATHAARLQRDGETWQVFDAEDRLIAEAPVVVVAAGGEAIELAPLMGLPLRRLRGQVSILPVPPVPALTQVVCREGYILPPIDGMNLIGASYDYGDLDPTLRHDSHAGNLYRLNRLIAGAGEGIDPAGLAGRVGFRCVAKDRLPMVGPVPDFAALQTADPARSTLANLPRQPGLYALLGLASRGVVWSQLAGELLAAQICGEALPMESDLVNAIDPARFWLREARTS